MQVRHVLSMSKSTILSLTCPYFIVTHFSNNRKYALRTFRCPELKHASASPAHKITVYLPLCTRFKAEACDLFFQILYIHIATHGIICSLCHIQRMPQQTIVRGHHQFSEVSVVSDPNWKSNLILSSNSFCVPASLPGCSVSTDTGCTVSAAAP